MKTLTCNIFIIGLCGMHQSFEFALHFIPGQRFVLFNKNHVVFSFCYGFGLNEQFFIQLFAGTKTDLHDIYILVGFKPAKTDHVFSHFQDLDRLSHIQYKQFTVLCDRTGQQNQLTRLGNGHEITNNALIR